MTPELSLRVNARGERFDFKSEIVCLCRVHLRRVVSVLALSWRGRECILGQVVARL